MVGWLTGADQQFVNANKFWIKAIAFVLVCYCFYPFAYTIFEYIQKRTGTHSFSVVAVVVGTHLNDFGRSLFHSLTHSVQPYYFIVVFCSVLIRFIQSFDRSSWEHRMHYVQCNKLAMLWWCDFCARRMCVSAYVLCPLYHVLRTMFSVLFVFCFSGKYNFFTFCFLSSEVQVILLVFFPLNLCFHSPLCTDFNTGDRHFFESFENKNTENSSLFSAVVQMHAYFIYFVL